MANYGQGPPTRVRTIYPPFNRERFRPPPKRYLAISEQRGAEMRARCEEAYRRVEIEILSQQHGDILLERLGDEVAALVSKSWMPAVAVATGPTGKHGTNKS